MRDIIVIGASAGGVEELIKLSRSLPRQLPASVFAVLHVSPEAPGLLPKIMQRRSAFEIKFPEEQEPIRPGIMYIAPPDHHIILSPRSIHLSHGPKVNRLRPSVDALFCSAARAFGPRVVGVVLSGTGSDGTFGLQTIKESGGITVVQDPEEALFQGMPASALEQIPVDYVRRTQDMISLFEQLASTAPSPDALEHRMEMFDPPEKGKEKMADPSSKLESNLKKDKSNFRQDGDENTPRTLLTCPECGGVLWESKQGKLNHYECQIGHTFSVSSLFDGQGQAVEYALWAAIRALDERASLSRRLAERASEYGQTYSRSRFLRNAEEAEKSAGIIREIVTQARVKNPEESETAE